jgi:hypothetical protein
VAVFDKVKILNFVRNAVIISLYPGALGQGCDTNIAFDVRNWAANTIGVPQIWNSMNDRPPAIGLAHELVHAYHNQRGAQPGRELGDGTTTLFELLCVGLGPWANELISENAIRAQWPPQANFAADALNLRPVPRRDIYDPPGEREQPVQIRKSDGSI